MKLYLQTYSSNEHWKPAAWIVVAEVSEEQLDQLRSVRHALKSMEPLRAEAVLVRGYIDRWDVGFDEDGEPWHDVDTSREMPLRTELNRIEVTEQGFMFMAYVDECPDMLTTEQVQFDGKYGVEYYAVPPWEREK